MMRFSIHCLSKYFTAVASRSFLSILVVMVFAAGPLASHVGSESTVTEHFSPEGVAGQTSRDISRLLRQVKFGNESKQAEAKERLLALGNSSAQARGEIVTELLNVIPSREQIRRKLIVSDQGYRTFKVVIELLGRLKAIESLNILIACLDCNDGRYGESASVFPVQGAVAAMGEAAIPWLETELGTARPQIRVRAATTLSIIGTDKARTALENASITEKDPDVKWAITIALRAFDSRQTK